MKKIGMIGGKFLPLHTGHLFAVNVAHTLVDKLYVVLSSSVKRDVQLCAPNFKVPTAEVRMSWLGKAFKNFENIEIINIDDDQWVDDYDWDAGADQIKKAIPEKITHVFSSERGYKPIFKKNYPDAEHVLLDPARINKRISGTLIRQNVYANWDYLPPYVREFFVKKIAIVGTESVGKSMLAEKLAMYYNTNFVHEIGRDYCEEYKNLLTSKMFDDITMKHFLAHREATKYSNKFLFVDSEAIITQYYLNMYLNHKSSFISTVIHKQYFDLVLYLETDVKWVDDGIRFAGEANERVTNNKVLKGLFNLYDCEYKTINGPYFERFKEAVRLVEEII